MKNKPEKKAKAAEKTVRTGDKKGFFDSIVVKTSLAMTVALLVIGLVISFSSINQFSGEIVRNSEESVELVASETANFLNEKIKVYMRYIDGLSHEYSVYADHLGMKDKLGEYAADVGLGDIGYADKNGDTWTASKELVSIAQRPYFQKAMQGEWNISDVVIDPTSGKPIMMMAIPLVKAGTISGVMYARNDAAFLSQFVVDAKYGEHGVTFIMNEQGVTMAHPDVDMVINQTNMLDAAKDMPGSEAFVEIMKKALSEDKGFATCEFTGSEKYIGYATLPDYGWKVVVMADAVDVLAGQKKVTTTSLILTLAFIIIGMLFAYFLLRRFLSPLKGIEREMRRISTGDLSQPVNVKLVSKKDEMASLTNSLSAMQDNLKKITEDVKVSAVELDNKSNELNRISKSSQTAISQINNAIEDIAKGSSSQAQDTSNAMANIEELNSSMDTIQQEAEELLAKAEATKVISENAKTIMGELLDISEMTKQRIGDIVQQSEANVEATKSIESIIDTIQSIASQTNLLSLNASIEAARAGEMGRGFAVVADEIGKLAKESSDAASSIQQIISTLISDISDSAGKTNELAEFSVQQDEKIEETTKTFDEVIENIDIVTSATKEIGDSIGAIDSVKVQISTVIENLSAISEENAASAQQTAASASMILEESDKLLSSSQDVSDKSKHLSTTMEYFK